MDGDGDADLLEQFLLLVLQQTDRADLEVQLLGIPSSGLYPCVDQQIHARFTIPPIINVVLSEEGDLSTAREVFQFQDAKGLACLGCSFAEPGHDTAHQDLTPLEGFSVVEFCCAGVAYILQDDAILV